MPLLLSLSLHPSSTPSLPLSTPFPLLYRNIKLVETRKVGRRGAADASRYRAHWKLALFSLYLLVFSALSCRDYPFSFPFPSSLVFSLVNTRACLSSSRFRGTDKGERRTGGKERERIEAGWRKREGKKGSSTRPISVHILAGTPRALSRSVISPIVCQRPKGEGPLIAINGVADWVKSIQFATGEPFPCLRFFHLVFFAYSLSFSSLLFRSISQFRLVRPSTLAYQSFAP